MQFQVFLRHFPQLVVFKRQSGSSYTPSGTQYSNSQPAQKATGSTGDSPTTRRVSSMPPSVGPRGQTSSTTKKLKISASVYRGEGPSTTKGPDTSNTDSGGFTGGQEESTQEPNMDNGGGFTGGQEEGNQGPPNPDNGGVTEDQQEGSQGSPNTDGGAIEESFPTR